MKNVIKSVVLFATLLILSSCGNSEKKDNIRLEDYNESPQNTEKQDTEESQTKEEETASTEDPLSNKGIGPVKSLELPKGINSDMASSGADVFKKLCSACHKMDKKFVGPELAGVTERRSPEWIMNMILNPTEMIKKDPIAKKLLIESNMAVMANQGLSEEETRSILEYFRQYDQEN